jgi:hypothetical protein
MSEENKEIQKGQEDGQSQEPQAKQVDPQVEKEARIFGWVPKDEFRGSEDDWVDADVFVKRGKEINPILRKNNELLLKKLEEKSKEIDGIKASVEEFKQFQKESFERKAAEYEVQIAALKTKKREAIAAGDGDSVVDIDDQIDELKEAQREAKKEATKKPEEPPKTEAQASVPEDPELQSWLGRNQWFGSDTEMTDMANGLGASVRKQFPHLTGRAFLDKLDEKIVEYFPHKVLGNKSKGSAVDSGATGVRGGSASGKKSYDNLPQDAKEACDRFIANGWIKSKQEYVDSYDWS